MPDSREQWKAAGHNGPAPSPPPVDVPEGRPSLTGRNLSSDAAARPLPEPPAAEAGHHVARVPVDMSTLIAALGLPATARVWSVQTCHRVAGPHGPQLELLVEDTGLKAVRHGDAIPVAQAVIGKQDGHNVFIGWNYGWSE